MLGPAFGAAKRQLVDAVSLKVVRAIKTGQRLVVSPIGGKRMKHSSFIFDVDDGFGGCVCKSELCSATESPRELRLQGIIKAQLEQSHRVDVLAALLRRAHRGISMQQAPT